MWLATIRAYEARWTEEIHAEWTRNVLADHPDVTTAQLDRTRRLMSVAVPKGLVSSYEARTPTLILPDANDRHVLAAAIEAVATVIVTFNLSDFPDATLKAHGIEPLHPDVFLSALFDADTALFLRGVQQHRASLQNPPKTAADYIQTLRATGLRRLAKNRRFNSKAPVTKLQTGVTTLPQAAQGETEQVPNKVRRRRVAL